MGNVFNASSCDVDQIKYHSVSDFTSKENYA